MFAFAFAFVCVCVLVLTADESFVFQPCHAQQQQQQQQGEGRSSSEEPSIFADSEGNVVVQVGGEMQDGDATVFLNNVDLLSALRELNQTNTNQQAVLSTQQSTIEHLTSQISMLPCRSIHPVPEGRDYTEVFGEGIYADFTSPHLTVSTGNVRWGTPVVSSVNGMVYGAPFNIDKVLLIDPATNEVDITSISVTLSTDGWYGIVEAGNGKLYFLPVGADNALIIDPANNNTVDQTSISALSTDTSKWYGGALAPNNGKIYCVPLNSQSVLIIDTADDTADTTTIADLPEDFAKWIGAILANNGLIYGIPYNSNNVLIIDPTTDTADYTSVSVAVGNTKWFDGVLANNGKIYGTPFFSGNVLVIDPANNNNVSYIQHNDASGAGRWVGGALTGRGKIITAPFSANHALIIDPATDTVDTTSISTSSSNSKWGNAVYLPQFNRMYMAPYAHTSILQIDLDPCPLIP